MFHFDLYYLLVFIPALMIIYSIFRKKYRKYILLLGSLFLFYSISGVLVIYVILSAFSIHHFGLWLKHLQLKRDIELEHAEKDEKKTIKEKYKKEQKKVVALAVILHIGLLVVLKYSGFFIGNINDLFKWLNISVKFDIPKFLLPIGISFYTLEAVSYIVDVYHEKIEAEESIIKLTLFLSYFAYLIEGPIVKYEDVKDSLFEGATLKYRNVTFGAQRIFYGLFKKIIIADRLNALIKTVFDNYRHFSGSIILFAAICYTIQLYMEFSGTMDVALGTSEIFGVKLPENFHNPFFSKNISEFWQRWHITLGRFFKDYIFYPVSLSKPVKKLTSWGRKHFGNYYGPVLVGSIALLCVWLSNGLWHGADWKYIFFGLYHFTLILLGSLLTPLIKLICKKMKINRDSKWYHFIQIIKTCLLVVIGELFFRANSLDSGITMFTTIFTNFNFQDLCDKFLILGLDICDYYILIGSLIVIFIISIMNEKGKSVRELVAKQPIVIRWIIYYLLILSITIFGAYGPKYVPVDPIYAEF